MKPYRRAVLVFSVVFVAIGVALLVGTAARRRRRRVRPRRRSSSCSASAAHARAEALAWRASSAGFERVLDAPALFAVAYGEIASSLYIALGIVAAQALGLTPLVLLVTGALFLLVSLSYAEGTAALPETGGAATFVRRAFNDLAGFVTGWVLFLDFLIVMALSALFVPHYLGAALSAPSLRESAVGRVDRLRADRRDRRRPARPAHAGCTSARSRVALLDLSCRASSWSSGSRFLLSPEVLDERLRLRERPGLERPRLRAAARDARLHRARDGRQPRRGGAEPGRTLPALALLRDRAGRRRHRR